MKSKVLICLLNLTVFLACKEPQPKPKLQESCNGSPCEIPYLWKKCITDEAYTYSCIDLPIVYNNAGLVAMRRNDSTFFQMIEPETGNMRWELHRKLRYDDTPLFEYEIWEGHKYNNYLITPFWGRNQCGFEKINLETGTLVSEMSDYYNLKVDFDGFVTGVDSLYFFVGRKKNDVKQIFEPTIMYGNVTTDIIQKLCDVPRVKQDENDTIEIQLISPTIINNQIHVLIGYTYKNVAYLSLYNKNTQSWVYTNIDYNVPWFSSYCFIKYPYFYLPTGREVNGRSESYFICGNITNGDIVWTNTNYGASRNLMEVDNNLITVDSYSNDIIGVDMLTGKAKWVIENLMPYRYMQILNGIIYFDNGNMYAIDSETGETLWELTAEDGTRFNECKVVPGKDGKKGHILASSDKHVYCFEAIR